MTEKMEKAIQKFVGADGQSGLYSDITHNTLFLVCCGGSLVFNEEFYLKNKNPKSPSKTSLNEQFEDKVQFPDGVQKTDIGQLLNNHGITFADCYHDFRDEEFLRIEDDFISVKDLEKFVKTVKRSHNSRRKSYLADPSGSLDKRLKAHKIWVDMIYDVQNTGYTVNGELLLDTIRCVTDKDFVRVKVPAGRFKGMYIEEYESNNFGLVMPVYYQKPTET